MAITPAARAAFWLDFHSAESDSLRQVRSNRGRMSSESRRLAERQSRLPAAVVRAQLERILTSETFVRSERLSSFLRYVVEETLRGDGGGLKEAVIGREVYGRGTDFDTAADPIVRVDARRLRDKLREYYSDSPGVPILITLPKGTVLEASLDRKQYLRPCDRFVRGPNTKVTFAAASPTIGSYVDVRDFIDAATDWNPRPTRLRSSTRRNQRISRA